MGVLLEEGIGCKLTRLAAGGAEEIAVDVIGDATKLGIRRSVLWDWLRGGIQPEKGALARLAGFLKRVGYL